MSSQPEVEWDEEQQDLMVALTIYHETKCPKCKGNLAETAAPENAEAYWHEEPVECFRCEAFERGRKAYLDHPYEQSLLHRVPDKPTRRPTTVLAQSQSART